MVEIQLSSDRVPQRRILTDDVYETVKAMVMDHDLAPGAHLNIDALARALQVSQTPVREALARLESDGLIVKQPLRGYTIAPLLSREEFEQLFELRFLLEPWAAARAAELSTAAQHRQLEAAFDDLKDIPSEGTYDAYRALTAHDERFHALIHTFSGNPLLATTFERLHAHLHIFRLYYGSGIGASAVDEHRHIVEAIRSGRPENADVAMRAHLTASRDRLRPVFDRTDLD
ncbi:GntR family transcriptional regulator [Actinopolymorpha alba]|uniref:GntR family transcriptional regulator n=1 Tax=Actinopolymorpha alba TaxID=533267 RepID=UPI000370708A|nr:GntR family transcriptional regulator [Actinopolymorpha alba]